MALTAEDLRDLVVLLETHPEWRKVLWALLASEEVLRMPAELAGLRAETERRFAELAEAVRRLSELFVAHRQEFLAQQAHTDARLAELTETVRRLSELFNTHRQEFLAYREETDRRFAELAEAQRRHYEEFAAHRQEFLAYREETDRRFAELAEAQRRTEESLAAHRAETDRRFAELAEAQRRHYEEFAAHRAETDRRFAELAEAQRRTEESLAAHRAETDRRFAELAEAQRRHYEEFVAHRAETDRRFAELSAEVRALAEAQRRTEEILQQVLLRQEQFQRTLDHFGQIIGPITEEHMVQALQEWIAQQGGTLLTPVVSITLDGLGEVDGLARARLPDGREAWLLVSAKAKVWARSITEFVERILRHPEARERLQAQGVGDPVLPVVFGRALDHRALEAAQRARVGLLIGRQGMLVPPALWSLSEGKPLGPSS
ncbi:MAG: hypothetical protein KNN16_13325 [Thermoflexus hugenholtzii]|uniref:hypothetical protein n=3 Tax=Thermoflexus TaxID=1495649 RepID=UPI001C76DDC2|nr:hypothetical protein [Thermoflexus hugenholtzii]QWK10332.1 MAG: hypothetical protein KNN16_13325 [Thermoflexus hugenholtzii]